MEGVITPLIPKSNSGTTDSEAIDGRALTADRVQKLQREENGRN